MTVNTAPLASVLVSVLVMTGGAVVRVRPDPSVVVTRIAEVAVLTLAMVELDEAAAEEDDAAAEDEAAELLICISNRHVEGVEKGGHLRSSGGTGSRGCSRGACTC